MAVRVQEEDFDLTTEVKRLSAGRNGIGAIVTFTGTVRGEEDGAGIASMTLEHYPGMTEAELARVEAEAHTRWPLVLVLTASAHRAAALESCAFLIDWLKTKAPFWKREEFTGGAERWVAAKDEDDTAAARWSAPQR